VLRQWKYQLNVSHRNIHIFISYRIVSYQFTGIINSTGKLWKDQRRFLHDKLRQFGMTYMGNGKQQMQKRIMVSRH